MSHRRLVSSREPLVLAVVLSSVLSAIAGAACDLGARDAETGPDAARSSDAGSIALGPDAAPWSGPIDAGDRRDGAPPTDAGLLPAGAPMFVAQGQGGRTIVSCDGRSWVGDRSVNGDPSDHGAYAAKGIAWGRGRFVAAFGWGAPAKMRVSSDGVTWRETFDGADPAARRGASGIAFGHDTFVVVSGETPFYSTDLGESWSRGTDLDALEGIVRYVSFLGDVFVATGDSGVLRVSDDGRVWRRPVSITGPCTGGGRHGGHAYGDGIALVASEGGAACRSLDSGRTWVSSPIGGGVAGNTIWTGGELYALDGSRAHVSDDAVAWTTRAFSPAALALRSVARDDRGAWVGLARDGVSFYASDDGFAWTEVPPERRVAGTDLVSVVAGYGERPAECAE